MIVLDASAAVEWLLRSPGLRVEQRIFSRREQLAAPCLLDVEFAQVLRRFTLSGELAAERAAEALEELVDIPLSRFPHEPLLFRAWELRANLTIYDGVYVALAEALRAPLLTCDARLRRAPGHHAKVEVL